MTSVLQVHWGVKALFITRIIWVLLHVVLLGYEYDAHGWKWYALLCSCLIIGAIPQLVWKRTMDQPSWTYPVIELVLSGLFLISASYVVGQYFSYLAIPALCAAAATNSTRLRVPLWIWFSLIPPLAMAIVLPLSSFTMSIIEGIFFYSLGYGIWKVLDTQRKMQQLLEENERQRQVLEQYAKQVEQIAILEERNRLARELHDTVGHTLTSVITGLDAVSYMLEEASVEVVESVNLLRTVSRKGLEEMRQHIHHIAPEHGEQSLSAQLKRIASEFAVHTRTSIEFEANGLDVLHLSVPLPITMTLVRCLQESLTNAKRHGGAEHIHISLAVLQGQLALRIQDDGCGMEEIQYGFGLSAMQDRIEAYQGELKITSGKNSGTTVLCLLPYRDRRAVS